MSDPNSNGSAPKASRFAAWAEWMESTYVQQVVALIVERMLRYIHFSFTAGGTTWSLSVTPAGTTVAVTYKDHEPCQSRDPEPSKAQSTATGTLV